MKNEYHDRFSDATKEISEHSGFICDACKKKYHKDEAEKKDMVCCDKPLVEVFKEAKVQEHP